MIPSKGFIDSSGQFASRKSLSTPGNWSLQLQKSAFIVLSSEIGGESACEQWVNSKNASECLLCARGERWLDLDICVDAYDALMS
jgi:hypothetical protein